MPRMRVRIGRLTVDQASTVFGWVERLLTELGEEAQDLGTLDQRKVLDAWRKMGDRFQVLTAVDDAGAIVGVLTLTESFAIYANGPYGVIDEMYVTPEMRSMGVGRQLVEAALAVGRQRGWTRIDVTAPEGPQWARSRHFYESLGFGFAGPKLKHPL